MLLKNSNRISVVSKMKFFGFAWAQSESFLASATLSVESSYTPVGLLNSILEVTDKHLLETVEAIC